MPKNNRPEALLERENPAMELGLSLFWLGRGKSVMSRPRRLSLQPYNNDRQAESKDADPLRDGQRCSELPQFIGSNDLFQYSNDGIKAECGCKDVSVVFRNRPCQVEDDA